MDQCVGDWTTRNIQKTFFSFRLHRASDPLFAGVFFAARRNIIIQLRVESN